MPNLGSDVKHFQHKSLILRDQEVCESSLWRVMRLLAALLLHACDKPKQDGNLTCQRRKSSNSWKKKYLA